MPLLVLHLSDIHFKTAGDVATLRPSSVARSVKDLDPNVDAVVVAVTGDIAFSGRGTEYSIALGFFERLCEELRHHIDAPIFTAIAPGNHDCDFSGDQGTRQLMIEGLLRQPTPAVVPSVTQVLTDIQRPFFDFLGALCPETKMLPQCEHLIWDTDLLVGSERILVRTYNSAWMSRKNEVQGELLFPTHLLPKQPPTHDLVLSLFHHPLNWFESTNSRAFRRGLEASSDIILTGHEHDPDVYRRQSIVEVWSADVHEGAMFSSGTSQESAFSAILIDLAAAKQKVFQARWHDNYYSLRERESAWQPFVRNRARRQGDFYLTEEFAEELESVGASFSHPRKGRLTISDIYVEPNLREVEETEASPSVLTPPISGQSLIQRLASIDNLVVLGAEASGKTTFARRIFKALKSSGSVPVLINAAHLEKADWDSTLKTIHAALNKQYGSNTDERFRQLDRERRALLLDDLQACELNPRARIEVMRQLTGFFGRVIAFSNEVELMQDLAGIGAHEAIAGFARFELLDFGHALRETLIERWILAGQEERLSSNDLERRVIHTKRIVDGALGRNLIPHHPIFILIILQQIEANTDIKTASGAFGYLYGTLITAALSRAGRQLDIDTAQNYLAEFAANLFGRRKQSLSSDEMGEFHEKYCATYNVRLRLDSVEAALGRAELFVFEHEYRFKFRYAYYYFVAKSLAARLAEDEGADTLDLLVNEVYREEFANILIFLTYLSKDRRILGKMLASARSIYEGRPRFSFSDHTFIESLIDGSVKRVLIETDARKSRQAANEHRDRIAEHDREVRSDEDSFNDALRLNEAFKTLQILGQTLKNFPGSLKADVKLEIARECYDLGLRTLRTMLELIERDSNHLIVMLKDKALGAIAQEERRDRIARRLIAWLAELFSVSAIRRVTDAVGSPMLGPTYEDLLRESDDLPVALVDLSLRLDHMQEFPEDAIRTLAKETDGVRLARGVLCRLVVMHFYRFERPRELRQRVCDLLDMEFRRITQIEHARITRESKKPQG